MNRERLMKMAGAVRTCGKGSVRRKKKAVHKTTTTDDKKLQSVFKKIGVNTFPGIEEVCILLEDDTVIQFLNPKVQAAAGTWVVSGSPQINKIEEVKQPGIMDQLGPDQLANFRKHLAAQFQMQASGAKANAGEKNEADDDDELPELVPGETFEAVAEEEQPQQASS